MASEKLALLAKTDVVQFSAQLLDWHRTHGRHDLPWQHQQAYPVWVSEVMLQQTQVSTVIPYYARFMQSFPDVVSLARASIDQVLQHWQGLGYYARARNLHRSAQIIDQQYAGQFPTQMEHVLALPGIGRSTAGAILTFSCQQSWPILDGNVKRILARCFQVDGWSGQAKTLKQFWSISEQVTPLQQTARFNQAMMDLGSAVCTRSKPSCQRCPLTKYCLSFEHQMQHLFPEKKPKKAQPLKQTLMLMIQCEDNILLYRRPPSGIWGGLWSLPEVDDVALISDWQRENALEVKAFSNLQEKIMRHKFTHFDLDISLAEFELTHFASKVSEADNLRWVSRSALADYGLPTPVRKILEGLRN